MSATRLQRSSPSPAPAPCASSPERWMDRRDRAHALATCLQCPIRRWCAQEALRVQASWGMWAGVWIDGHLSPVAPLLRSVATPAALPSVTSVAALPAGHAPVERRPLPRRRAPRWPGSAHTAVLVRSSGHCEVMQAGCGLNAHGLVSRVSGVPAEHAPSVAAAFAACRECMATVTDSVNQADAARLGYCLQTADQAAWAPFFWRSSRWVRFDDVGRLHDVEAPQQSRRAS